MQVVDKNGNIHEVYTVDELQSLKSGDKVFVEWAKWEDGYNEHYIEEAKVNVDPNGMMFMSRNVNHYVDLPNPEFVNGYAIQDSGEEWKFSIYKV